MKKPLDEIEFTIPAPTTVAEAIELLGEERVMEGVKYQFTLLYLAKHIKNWEKEHPRPLGYWYNELYNDWQTARQAERRRILVEVSDLLRAEE